jgi:hypothetical protein
MLGGLDVGDGSGVREKRHRSESFEETELIRFHNLLEVRYKEEEERSITAGFQLEQLVAW